MIIDISSIVTCENKSLTEKVQIELESFVSRLGEFPSIEKAPIDLQIANIDGGKLRISGTEKIKAYGLPKATHSSLIFNLYGRKIKIN